MSLGSSPGPAACTPLLGASGLCKAFGPAPARPSRPQPYQQKGI
ncbi:hypothetical protein AB0M57_23640 [Streptomyces sp. NPDC051597]